MSLHRTVLMLVTLVSLPVALQAHRQWMLPSSTVLSNPEGWVTIDAAVSNELFYFDHVPLRITNLRITAPDGSPVKEENVSTGKYRTTFDVHLRQPGTYKIALVSNAVFATWKDASGETRMWRGSADARPEIPAGASDLRTSRISSRVEVFVTAGKPTRKALEPVGAGLEMAPVTHPNDLFAGEPAVFQFLQDGKPAADLEVTLIPGGIRYRDQLNEIKATTDAQGKITVTFKDPGMYWMNAVRSAGGGPARMPAGDRATYTATLEVLPQ